MVVIFVIFTMVPMLVYIYFIRFFIGLVLFRVRRFTFRQLIINHIFFQFPDVTNATR